MWWWRRTKRRTRRTKIRLMNGINHQNNEVRVLPKLNFPIFSRIALSNYDPWGKFYILKLNQNDEATRNVLHWADNKQLPRGVKSFPVSKAQHRVCSIFENSHHKRLVEWFSDPLSFNNLIPSAESWRYLRPSPELFNFPFRHCRRFS